MEPGGKGVLYEIHRRRSPRRGAGDRRNQTGIKKNKRKQKKKRKKQNKNVRGLIRSIPDKPFAERKSQISTPIVTYRKVKVREEGC